MKKKRLIIVIVAAFIAVTAIFAVLVLKGIIRLNHPSNKKYPVRGVDVSSYQGKIDWYTLSAQNISFAFIKATEGSKFVDDNFAYNYNQAQKTNLRVGAYHFFSFDSSGAEQADNFINNVEKIEDMLPPVVDIEFYGDKKKNPPDKSKVRKQLDELLQKLESHYGIKPIIYATQSSYEKYISGAYDDYDIWIRNVYFSPYMPDEKQWTFWQYTDKGQLDGYSGDEKYIDINVFNGTEEQFKKYAQ